MARIVFVSQPRDAVAATDTQSGSVAIVLWELATRIAQQHDVVIVAPQAPGQAIEESSRSGVRIRRMPIVFRSLHKALDLATGAFDFTTPYFASSAFFREYALGVARWLKREQPDIVHVQVCSQFLPLFRAAVPTARLVLHVHDEFLALLPEDVIRSRLRHAAAVVTCSEFITRRLQMRLQYAREQIHTVGNGVNTAYFQVGESCERPERFTILYVGRVSPEKGIHTLAAAFNELAAVEERVELEIVGSAGLLPFNQIKLLSADPCVAALRPYYGTNLWHGVDKQLLRAHTSYWHSIRARLHASVRGRVHFRGPMTREMLKSAYLRAQVVAMPSLCEEPFGLPLVEAMASGLPCIASGTGGMVDIVEDEVTGLLIERGNVAALTAALQRLLSNSVERDSMGRSGRERAVKRFDWSLSAARLESLYHQTGNPALAAPGLSLGGQ